MLCLLAGRASTVLSGSCATTPSLRKNARFAIECGYAPIENPYLLNNDICSRSTTIFTSDIQRLTTNSVSLSPSRAMILGKAQDRDFCHTVGQVSRSCPQSYSEAFLAHIQPANTHVILFCWSLPSVFFDQLERERRVSVDIDCTVVDLHSFLGT